MKQSNWEDRIDDFIKTLTMRASDMSRLLILNAVSQELATQRKEILDEIADRIETLEKEIMPTHAEENGYGCSLEDIKQILNEIK